MTDNEARRYGRFLLGLLETVMTWHSDPAVFELECAQFPGFLTVFRNALNSSSAQSVAANKQEQLDYENFRHVCHKWHYKLTKSFIVCLESGEYVQMRNSLVILTKILPFYPKLIGFCSALEKRVEKIKSTEKDKKQDIYTLASVYLGQLKQRKAHMVDEGKFHLKEPVTPTTKAEIKQSPISANKNDQTDQSKFKQPNSVKPQTITAPGANFASKQIAAVLHAVSSTNTPVKAALTSVPTTAASSTTTNSSNVTSQKSANSTNTTPTPIPAKITTKPQSDSNGIYFFKNKQQFELKFKKLSEILTQNFLNYMLFNLKLDF